MNKDLYFHKANMTVNDWWVVVGDKEYSMPTILSAEVATTEFPLDWLKFVKDHLAFTAVVALFSLGASLFTESWAILPFLWIFQIVQEAFAYGKKSVEHTLILNTRDKTIPIASLDDSTYIYIVAKEINSRIKDNSLTTLVQKAGIPTRRVVSD